MPGNNHIRWEVLAAAVLRTVSMPHAYAWRISIWLLMSSARRIAILLPTLMRGQSVSTADGKTVHWREYELLIHHFPGQTYFTMGIPIVFVSSPLSSTLGLPRRFAAGWSPAIRRIGRSSSPSVSIGHS